MCCLLRRFQPHEELGRRRGVFQPRHRACTAALASDNQ